eukprot:TRINITY_DN1858_c0_g1_i7.p2 TRINITY_DN1858_c0_g1~~TRINITY_DN1858_c0_g1_i7.p2  ORF type:complete len:106 (+),score=11.63 TRINITY_DN1858_c0_g1_i7:181-498(+)
MGGCVAASLYGGQAPADTGVAVGQEARQIGCRNFESVFQELQILSELMCRGQAPADTGVAVGQTLGGTADWGRLEARQIGCTNFESVVQWLQILSELMRTTCPCT